MTRSTRRSSEREDYSVGVFFFLLCTYHRYVFLLACNTHRLLYLLLYMLSLDSAVLPG